MRPVVLSSCLSVVLLAATACISVRPQVIGSVPDSRRDTVTTPGIGPVGGGSLVDRRTDSKWAEKRVSRKIEPTTLVAQDNDQCDVSSADFHMTAVGQTYSCNWRGTPKPGK